MLTIVTVSVWQADCQYGEWGFDGIDNEHVGIHSNTGALFVGMSKEKVSVQFKAILQATWYTNFPGHLVHKQ
jgi:hypothetical protein